MVSESTVRSAYTFLFGTPPGDDAVQPYLSEPDLKRVFERMVGSEQFLAKWESAGKSHTPTVSAAAASDAEVIAQFPRYTGPGEPGFIIDFVGNKMRTSFVGGLKGSGGQVWLPPTPTWNQFHPFAEWVGTLRAVLEADPSRPFVVFELGAGWAPWCVAAIVAGRQKGLRQFHATAVEASLGHLQFIREHFADNGVSPGEYTLRHAAVMAADGVAEFTALDEAADHYGGGVGDVPLVIRPPISTTVQVPAVGINTLLNGVPRVDLMHIDIQGCEADAVAVARAELKAKVRRMVIGTHNREIEHRLLTDLSADGWQLEMEEACAYHIGGGKFHLLLDGNQVWRNPSV